MASLFLRGKTWWIKYQRAGKTVRASLKTSNKRVARREQQAIEAAIFEQGSHTPTEHNPTPDDFWDAYLPWAFDHLKRKSVEAKANKWRAFIDWCQPARMGSITHEDAEGYKAHLLKRGRAKATINAHLRELQSVISQGNKLGLYSGPNPFQGIERYRLEQSPPDFYAEDEATRLLDAAEGRGRDLHLLVALGLYGGLRKAELLACSWSWFDWRRKTLDIPSDAAFSTKSHKGRTIPLSAKLIAILRPYKGKDGFVVCPEKTECGSGHYRVDLRDSFNAVREQASVPRATLHGLRRTFGSLLVQAGISIYKVSLWLGHSSVTVTQNHYAALVAYDADIDRI